MLHSNRESVVKVPHSGLARSVPIKLGVFPNSILQCNIGIMGTIAGQQ